MYCRYDLTIVYLYNICDSAVHDELASLDRHAQLTRCFSAQLTCVIFSYVAAPALWLTSECLDRARC